MVVRLFTIRLACKWSRRKTSSKTTSLLDESVHNSFENGVSAKHVSSRSDNAILGVRLFFAIGSS